MRLRQDLTVSILYAVSVITEPVNIRSEYAVKDSHPVPDGWSYVGRASPDHVIELHIALRQAHFDILEKHLYEGKPSGISRLCGEFTRYSNILVMTLSL